jgi:competence protein ComEA
VPENVSTRPAGALAPPLEDRRAALGLPPPVEAPTLRARVEGVADAMGTTAARLVAGAVVAVLVLAAVGWTLAAGPGAGGGVGGGGHIDDAALPRAMSGGPGGAASASADDAATAPVVVAAAGAVARPGVYRLAAGARVQDVVAAAGGVAADADIDQVNLAAPVGDGERVYVPRKGERPPDLLTGGPVPPGSAGALTQPVNLNSATAEQLDALPGIGPATARAIIAWRQQHGRFKRVDDLLNVRGIGPAKLDALRLQVRV